MVSLSASHCLTSYDWSRSQSFQSIESISANNLAISRWLVGSADLVVGTFCWKRINCQYGTIETNDGDDVGRCRACRLRWHTLLDTIQLIAIMANGNQLAGIMITQELLSSSGLREASGRKFKVYRFCNDYCDKSIVTIGSSKFMSNP